MKKNKKRILIDLTVLHRNSRYAEKMLLSKKNLSQFSYDRTELSECLKLSRSREAMISILTDIIAEMAVNQLRRQDDIINDC